MTIQSLHNRKMIRLIRSGFLPEIGEEIFASLAGHSGENLPVKLVSSLDATSHEGNIECILKLLLLHLLW